jgi:hypothetical protein
MGPMSLTLDLMVYITSSMDGGPDVLLHEARSKQTAARTNVFSIFMFSPNADLCSRDLFSYISNMGSAMFFFRLSQANGICCIVMQVSNLIS